jgi:hypothetical protein
MAPVYGFKSTLLGFVGLSLAIGLPTSPMADGGPLECTILYQLKGPGNLIDPQFGASGNTASDITQIGQFAGYAYLPSGPITPQALLWDANGNPIQLNPTGFTNSFAYGTDGVHQVGSASGPGTQGNSHAFLWTGSAGSAVDLEPVNLNGINDSEALDLGGGQEVGYGTGPAFAFDHALLWTGTAASAVDLNPTVLTHFIGSIAMNTNGAQQVGFGMLDSTFVFAHHAMLWSGTADSAVDLNPTNFTSSSALATNGTQQAGVGTDVSGDQHALLWNGTADSAVDLNPNNVAGFDSGVQGMNATEQVGWDGPFGGFESAVLWSGTADSAVELQPFLPASGSWKASSAWTVDSAGDVYGTAIGSYNGSFGIFLVEWSPTAVPEPTTFALFGLSAVGLLKRHRW